MASQTSKFTAKSPRYGETDRKARSRRDLNRATTIARQRLYASDPDQGYEGRCVGAMRLRWSGERRNRSIGLIGPIFRSQFHRRRSTHRRRCPGAMRGSCRSSPLGCVRSAPLGAIVLTKSFVTTPSCFSVKLHSQSKRPDQTFGHRPRPKLDFHAARHPDPRSHVLQEPCANFRNTLHLPRSTTTTRSCPDIPAICHHSS